VAWLPPPPAWLIVAWLLEVIWLIEATFGAALVPAPDWVIVATLPNARCVIVASFQVPDCNTVALEEFAPAVWLVEAVLFDPDWLIVALAKETFWLKIVAML
jgi:hypothetical protein